MKSNWKCNGNGNGNVPVWTALDLFQCGQVEDCDQNKRHEHGYRNSRRRK